MSATERNSIAPEIAGLPIEDGAPVFREPWEAQAFALAVKLHECGVFTWPEWAAMLSKEIAEAQASGDPDRGDTYYRHWQRALEKLIVEKGLAAGAEIEDRVVSWREAYLNTPHGQPVELSKP